MKRLENSSPFTDFRYAYIRSKKITSNSLDKPETKGLFDGMTLEDFLVIANNQIANEPANPDGYANRGLIYFHLKNIEVPLKTLINL